MPTLPPPERIQCAVPRDGVPCEGDLVVTYYRGPYGGTYSTTAPCPECATVQPKPRTDLLAAAFRFTGPDTRRNLMRKVSEPLEVRSDRDVDNAAAWRALCEMPDKRSVVLRGAVEAGKTYLALHAVKRLCEAGVGCVYVTECELVELVRLTGYKNSRQEEARGALDAMRAARVLVIDDFGQARAGTARDATEIERLLTQRYDADRGMILTTNRTDAELAVLLGGRMASRLFAQSGRPVPVHGRWRTGR